MAISVRGEKWKWRRSSAAFLHRPGWGEMHPPPPAVLAHLGEVDLVPSASCTGTRGRSPLLRKQVIEGFDLHPEWGTGLHLWLWAWQWLDLICERPLQLPCGESWGDWGWGQGPKSGTLFGWPSLVPFPWHFSHVGTYPLCPVFQPSVPASPGSEQGLSSIRFQPIRGTWVTPGASGVSVSQDSFFFFF